MVYDIFNLFLLFTKIIDIFFIMFHFYPPCAIVVMKVSDIQQKLENYDFLQALNKFTEALDNVSDNIF